MKLYHKVFVILFLFACNACQINQRSVEKEDSVKGNVPSATLPKPAVHVVEIRQMKFEPGEIRVKKGDEVRWVNRDITNHDVTEQSSKAWASSPLSTGESWTMVATESVDYYCNLHQVMKGRIVVE